MKIETVIQEIKDALIDNMTNAFIAIGAKNILDEWFPLINEHFFPIFDKNVEKIVLKFHETNCRDSKLDLTPYKKQLSTSLDEIIADNIATQKLLPNLLKPHFEKISRYFRGGSKDKRTVDEQVVDMGIKLIYLASSLKDNQEIKNYWLNYITSQESKPEKDRDSAEEILRKLKESFQN